MTKINIPPAALEVGAKGAWDAERARLSEYTLPPWENLHPEVKKQKIDHARASFEAMVAAWPNQHIIDDDVVYIQHALILPLPQEGGDADSTD